MVTRWVAATLAACTVLLGGHALAAASLPSLDGVELADPIFDIVFAPADTHYDVMPDRIRELCKDFDDPYNWVFAHVQKNGADYYVVMSWGPDGDSDPLGNGVKIAGNTCEVSAFGNMLTGFVPQQGYSTADNTAAPQLPGVDAPWIRNAGDTQGNYHYEFRSQAEEEVLRDLIRDGAAQGERIWGAARLRAMVCPYDGAATVPFAPLYVEERHAYCDKAAATN